MNTISNSQNSLDVYALKKLQETKASEQSRLHQHHKRQLENDSISISQQGLQGTQGGSPLDSLVSAGTITQDQADAVQSVFQSRGKEIQTSGTYSNKTKHQNPLDSLVSAGTITQEQKDAIDSTLRSSIQPKRQSVETTGTRTSPLDSLVTDGTITQEQADAVDSAFKALMEAHKSKREQETSTTKTNPLDSLVSAGTITQEQEDAIQSTLQAAMNFNRI